MNEQSAIAIITTLCQLLGHDVPVDQVEQAYRQNLETLRSPRLRPDEFGAGD
jgi:hypothetical protein